MTMLLSQLAREGYAVNADTLAHLSPYLYKHIQRFGSYTMDLDKLPDAMVFELDLPDTT